MDSGMELIFRDASRDVWITRLERPFSFTSPCTGKEFALMLFVFEGYLDTAEQGELSKSFVAGGCRYAVCAGHECSTWDASIDWAYMEKVDYEPRDGDFVMTTWHQDESLDDVVRFFLRGTCFNQFFPSRFVAVCLGGSADECARVRSALLQDLDAASEQRE